MASQIDETVPVYGNPTTQSVRANFATAKVEISDLQDATVGNPFLPKAGGVMQGPMYLYNDPTDKMMPVTLGYAQANFGVPGGPPAITEAPTDGKFYTRGLGAWEAGVALTGGTVCQMTGEFLLAGNPADALGAVPKQYADAIGTTANGAVQKAGDTMTGLLLLSGDPTAPLGATTKQYTDAGLALKANAANPTFTGIATFTGGRNIISMASGPSLTLYDTTTNRPCFGVYNNGGYFSVGLSNASTGVPSGNPFLTIDQNGYATFASRLISSGGRVISTAAGGAVPSVAVIPSASGQVPFAMYPSLAGTSTPILAFGLTDGAGAPSSTLAWIDNAGNGNFGGGLSVGGTLNSPHLTTLGTDTGFYLQQDSGNARILSWAGGVYDYYQPSNGIHYWTFAGNNIMQLANNGSLTLASDLHAVNVYTSANVQCSGVFVGGGVTYWSYLSGYMYCPQSVQANAFVPISDETLKENIKPLTRGLDVINKLMPHSFVMKATPDETQLGFVAQDVQQVLPEAVPARDVLGIDLMALLAVAVNAIKELSQRVEALEGAH